MRCLFRNRWPHQLSRAPSHSNAALPATVRICADGGANRLYDEVPRLLDSSSEDSDVQIRSQFLPQSIRGDLDSVRGDVRDFYASKGVEITDLAADQDTTDLQKCLHAVEELSRLNMWEPGSCSIVAVGEHLLRSAIAGTLQMPRVPPDCCAALSILVTSRPSTGCFNVPLRRR